MLRHAKAKLFAAALLGAAGLIATTAQAHSFHSSSTISGPQGGAWQHSGSTNFGPGYADHSSSVTGPGGETATRSGSTTYGDGSYSHDVTRTGPNGQSTGWSSTGTYGAGE
jgi:hypothetical protein